MRNLESLHAEALCRWWAYFASRNKIDQTLLIHIPNEGKRSRLGGWRMKMQGLRPGIPDYFLAYPSLGLPGLFIELKTGKGKLSKEQSNMCELLSRTGYQVYVAFGWKSAAETIEKYVLGNDPSNV